MYRTLYSPFAELLWLFLLLGVLLSFIFRRSILRRTLRQQLALLIFYFYLLGLAKFTLFPLSLTLPPFYRPLPSLLTVALPFSDLSSLLGMPGGLHPLALAANIAGNFLLFLPFGFLSPHLRTTTWTGILKSAFLLSVSIELAQLSLAAVGGTVRIVSSDDLILNVAGALLGYGLARLLNVATASRYFPARARHGLQA
jgi:glycopeptide antibiotics resistance protein